MGQNIVIIGAGDRLGRQLTEKFLRLGWNVYAGYLPGDDVPEPAERMTVFGFDPLDHFYSLAARKKVGVAVDMLLVNIDRDFDYANATIESEIDYDALIIAYQYNCLGVLYAVNTFMPLLEKGELKRICVVTTKDASINSCEGVSDYGAHLSRAPLNMAMTQLFNQLRPEGYTFRLYCKDTVSGNDAWAVDYFTRARSYEPEDLMHSDEERLIMRDAYAREVPW
jgi:hypothetical protein